MSRPGLLRGGKRRALIARPTQPGSEPNMIHYSPHGAGRVRSRRRSASPGANENAELSTMKMFIAGQWVDRPQRSEVRNPFDGTVIDTVPKATRPTSSGRGRGGRRGAADARACRATSAIRSCSRASRLMAERREKLGRLISPEEGKDSGRWTVRSQPRGRNDRTFGRRGQADRRRSVAARRRPAGAGKLGFTLRVPCGVVAGHHAVQLSA